MKRKKRQSVTPKAKTSSSKSKRVQPKNSFFVKISLLIIILFIIFITVFKITEFFLNNINKFPRLEISLKDAPIERIDMDPKTIKYTGNTVTLTTNNDFNVFKDVEIKGRGNSSWAQPKRSYQIKLSEKANLANLKSNSNEQKKWLLLADYVDPSYLRNDIAFYIEKIINTPHVPDNQFVELYFDNHYHGLYFLTSKVEINSSSINLKDPSGIIVELDNFYGEDCKYSKNGDCYTIKEAVSNDAQETLTSFVDEINKLESAIATKNFDKINSIIDVDSFARYFFLNEFTVNPDAYSSSFFLYKDGDADKIHAGPGWDFDFALGNRNWNALEINYHQFHSPYESKVLQQYKNCGGKDSDGISTLLYDLMDIPEFEAKVKAIYKNKLFSKQKELLAYIREQADYIRPAALRDQERWKFTTDFDEEVDYLIDWVEKRLKHFDSTYGYGGFGPAILDPAYSPDATSIEPNEE